MRWWFSLTLVAVLMVASLALSGCGLIAKKQRAGLQVTTQDNRASVFLNGTYLNTTPMIEKNLAPGEYVVKIIPDDAMLAPFEEDIRLYSGTLTTITWQLAESAELSSGSIYELERINPPTAWWHTMFPPPVVNHAEINLSTIPEGAIISFDTQEKTFSPVNIKSLSPGKVRYGVSLPSYEAQENDIELPAGYRAHMHVKLGKLPDAKEAAVLAAQRAANQVLAAAVDATSSTSASSSVSGKKQVTTNPSASSAALASTSSAAATTSAKSPSPKLGTSTKNE